MKMSINQALVACAVVCAYCCSFLAWLFRFLLVLVVVVISSVSISKVIGLEGWVFCTSQEIVAKMT